MARAWARLRRPSFSFRLGVDPNAVRATKAVVRVRAPRGGGVEAKYGSGGGPYPPCWTAYQRQPRCSCCRPASSSAWTPAGVRLLRSLDSGGLRSCSCDVRVRVLVPSTARRVNGAGLGPWTWTTEIAGPSR